MGRPRRGSEGAARLSLRQSAEHAGLSRQAPYNHFVDKEALLAELVRKGYERLGDQIRGDASPGVAPSERLARAAEAYIAFGQERPALFRLMFSKELVDLSKHESAQQAASAALAELSAIIEAMSPGADTREVSLVAWSLVHGYTSLCVETGLEGGRPAEAPGPPARAHRRGVDAGRSQCASPNEASRSQPCPSRREVRFPPNAAVELRKNSTASAARSPTWSSWSAR